MLLMAAVVMTPLGTVLPVTAGFPPEGWQAITDGLKAHGPGQFQPRRGDLVRTQGADERPGAVQLLYLALVLD